MDLSKTFDCCYGENFDKWEQIRACTSGKKKVLTLVSSVPKPSYTMYCNKFDFSYLGDQVLIDNATIHAQNKSAINAQRAKEYWSRGRFFGATGRTVEAFHGMIWSKPPVVNLSDAMATISESIDGYGTPIEELAKEITRELVMLGRYVVLSDMPGTDRQLTAAEIEMPQYSPKLIRYKAEQAIFAMVQDGQLTELRLLEEMTARDPENEFVYEVQKQVRRLVLKEPESGGAAHLSQ